MQWEGEDKVALWIQAEKGSTILAMILVHPGTSTEMTAQPLIPILRKNLMIEFTTILPVKNLDSLKMEKS
jgi:hypothetical protein